MYIIHIWGYRIVYYINYIYNLVHLLHVFFPLSGLVLSLRQLEAMTASLAGPRPHKTTRHPLHNRDFGWLGLVLNLVMMHLKEVKLLNKKDGDPTNLQILFVLLFIPSMWASHSDLPPTGLHDPWNDRLR